MAKPAPIPITTGVVFMKAIHVTLRQGLERGPGLSARRHVLPLLFANEAFSGRLRAFRVLRAAGGADVEGHECPLAIVRVARTSALDAFSFCKAAMQAMRPMQAVGGAIFQQAVNGTEQFNVSNLCLVQSKIFVISGLNATDSRGTKNDIAQNKISHCGCRFGSARHGSGCPHGAYACAVTCSTRHERQSHHPARRPARISASTRCDRLRHGERFGLRKARNAVADVNGGGNSAGDYEKSKIDEFSQCHDLVGIFTIAAIFLFGAGPALSQPAPHKTEKSGRDRGSRQNCHGKTRGLSA